MNRFQIVAVVIGTVMLMLVGAGFKLKQCQYMAPDNVTYCMLMTR